MYQITVEFPQTMHLFKIGDKVDLSPIKKEGKNTGGYEITNGQKKFSTGFVSNLIGPRVLLSDFLVKL